MIENEDICTTARVIVLPNNISLTEDVRGCGVTTATIDHVLVDGVSEPVVLSVSSDLLGGQMGGWHLELGTRAGNLGIITGFDRMQKSNRLQKGFVVFWNCIFIESGSLLYMLIALS